MQGIGPNEQSPERVPALQRIEPKENFNSGFHVRTSAHTALLVAIAAAAFAPVSVNAQGVGTISGTVVSQRTGSPASGVQIAVEGQTANTLSDAAGAFRLTSVAGSGEVTLTLRRIGFQLTTHKANVGATGVRIEMVDRVVELSQLVVTGTAGVAEKRAIGNAVSTVNAADIVATQPVRNFQELLTVRARGAVSLQARAGGNGARIRIRGAHACLA